MEVNEYSSDEWEDILSGEVFCGERVKKSMESGVPDALRPSIWGFLSKEQAIPYLYAKLQSGFDDEVSDCIIKDLNRTFPNLPQFNQDALMHILQAYSLFDIEVGYCQGMSFVAGILFLVMQEEETAFWAFVFVMHEKGWRGMFLNGTPKLNQVLGDFENMIKRDLPAVYKKFKENDVEMIMLSQHFITVMGYRVKLRFSVRIMDVFLCHKEEILSKVLFKMIKFKAKKILSLKNEYLFRYLLEHLINECYEEFHISTFFT